MMSIMKVIKVMNVMKTLWKCYENIMKMLWKLDFHNTESNESNEFITFIFS